MAARSFGYHAHGTAGSQGKSCGYPWFVCHDKTAMHARPPPPRPPPPDDEPSY